MLRTVSLIWVASALLATSAFAQSAPTLAASPAADWAVHAQNEYQEAANVTYMTASGTEAKLDVYRRRDVTTPQRTLRSTQFAGPQKPWRHSIFLAVSSIPHASLAPCV